MAWYASFSVVYAVVELWTNYKLAKVQWYSSKSCCKFHTLNTCSSGELVFLCHKPNKCILPQQVTPVAGENKSLRSNKHKQDKIRSKIYYILLYSTCHIHLLFSPAAGKESSRIGLSKYDYNTFFAVLYCNRIILSMPRSVLYSISKVIVLAH